ncbi:MAG TPA: RDD family protein [Gemmatimonadales bacterium]
MEQRIGFGKRFGALILDCILVFVLSWLGAGTIGAMFGGTAASIAARSMAQADTTAVSMAVVGGIMGAVIGMVIAFVVIGTLYFLVEGFTGFTLGKLILGIRIANADGTAAGVPALLGRYLIKNCYYVLSLLGVVTGVGALGTLGTVGGLIIIVGCFFTLGTAKQAFHDMIMKTAVYPKAAIKA